MPLLSADSIEEFTSNPLSIQRAGLMAYHEALELQRKIHGEVATGIRSNTFLLLEHPSIYTAGKRTTDAERPTDGTPVVNVDRGGKITWHGPGQLVGYPIVRLPDPIDVIAHVRRIEAMLIEVCAEFGVTTSQVKGRSGVWVTADDRGPDRKIAAIGIRVTQGVTMHGFALNCDNDLAWFDRIVPCGIRDAEVTTLSQETGRRITVADVLPAVRAQLPLVLTA